MTAGERAVSAVLKAMESEANNQPTPCVPCAATAAVRQEVPAVEPGQRSAQYLRLLENMLKVLENRNSEPENDLRRILTTLLAVEQAARLRAQLMATPTGGYYTDKKTGKRTPVMEGVSITLDVMVVKRGGKYEIVVASNKGPGELPENVAYRDAEGTLRTVIGGYPIVYPPPRDPGTVPAEGDTGLHAEQRGMRWADSQDDVEGIVSHTPTRPCCEGCTRAIQDQGDRKLDSVAHIRGLSKSKDESIQCSVPCPWCGSPTV